MVRMESQPLDESGIRSCLPAEYRNFCHQLSVFQEIDSTNSRMASHIKQAKMMRGDVYFAESQTAGRGRLNRTWVSPPNGNIYFSVLWSHEATNMARHQISLLPLSIGVSIATYLMELLGGYVSLKWPNDILLEGKKISGILVESIKQAGTTYWIIGVGLNLGDMTAHEMPNSHVSPGFLGGLIPDCLMRRNEIAAKMLEAVYDACFQFENETARAILKKYEQLDYLKGRALEIQNPNGEIINGYSDGIETDGSLRVIRDGEIERYYSGDIRLKIK